MYLLVIILFKIYCIHSSYQRAMALFFAKKQGFCLFIYQLGTGTCIRIRIIVIRIVQTER